MTTEIGRPTKLTPELIEKLSGYVAQGNYFSTACGKVGINDSTLYVWLEKGRQDSEAGVGSILTDLLDSLKKAEADAETIRVGRINAAGEKGNWLADMTHLERRHPDRWGRKDRTQPVIDNRSIKITHVTVVKDYGGEPKLIEGGNDAIQGRIKETGSGQGEAEEA